MLLLLKDFNEIKVARSYLKKSNLSFLKSKLINRISTKKWIPIEPLGDINKSWDIFHSLNIMKYLSCHFNSKILDMGSFGSEITHIMNKMGYRNISAVDFNPNLKNSKHGLAFCKNLFIGDMYEQKTYYGNKFDLITNFSVLEHGYDKNKFINIIDNILNEKGTLLISFDYSSYKLDTSQLRLFNLSWDIFTPEMVSDLVKSLSQINVIPIIDNNYEILKNNYTPISHHGLDYTFAFMGFKRISK